MPRRSLVEALEQLDRRPFDGVVFRHISLRYDALDGDGARVHGGRWNPEQSFPVLYTALRPAVVFAEVRRHAIKAGVLPQDLLPRKLVSYKAGLQRVLDLADEANLDRLNLDPQQLVGDRIELTQAIGDAAHYIGYEGVLAQSATGLGVTLAIFPYRLTAGSFVEPIEQQILEALPPTDS